MDRRGFLIWAPAAAVAGVSLLAAPGYLFKKFVCYGAESANGELAKVVEAYLKDFPQEQDLHFLSESLGLKLENAADKSFLTEPMIVAHIQQDFEEGRVVSVAGWILSRTEARVLSLLMLLKQVK